ncbi:MAG: acyl-CoA dehydrogenase family protein, partial [Acidimicrobiales bacterium]
LIGGENNGWAVANTTLANERAGLGSGGGSGAGGAVLPGTVGGALDRRCGDFVGPEAGAKRNGASKRKQRAGSHVRPESGKAGTGAEGEEQAMLRALSGGTKLLVDLAKSNGTSADPQTRQGLARLYSWGELGRFNGLRLKAVKAGGGDIPGMPNISKLSMSHIMRLSRDLGLQISGAAGMLHGYNQRARDSVVAVTGYPLVAFVTEMALFAQAPPIYGGTDQIQRNIIGERVLGFPKEPNDDRTTPFAELPKNV